MAKFQYCLLLLVALVYSVQSFNEVDEDDFRQQEEMAMLSRAVDTYQVTRYIPGLSNKTIRDCDRSLRNVYNVQIAAIRTDDGTEYLGHIVSNDYSGCFADVTRTVPNLNLKTCAEDARTNDAISFKFDQATSTCTQYSNWREHKFRQCKRGSNEAMYYLRVDAPPNFNACSGITMSLNAAYTSDGSVIVTATFPSTPCICDVNRITYAFLGNTREMTITPTSYTYTYTSAEQNNWQNTTTVIAYIDTNTEVVRVENYIPADQL